MTPSRSSTTVDDWNTDEFTPRRSSARLRVSLVTTIATTVVAMGLLSGQGESARADDKDLSKPGSSVPESRSYRAFVSEVQQALKRSDDRLIELVNPILEKAAAPDPLQDLIAGLEAQVRSAEARYHISQLDRAVAEIARDEYQK
jgi:hypothetical protein